MPDLVGLTSAEALQVLGKLDGSADLGLNWGRPVSVRCGVRPETIAGQQPDPGTPLTRRTVLEIRTARLDLQEFRGPCEPADGDLGPLGGPDAELARRFYRFAADPSLDASFLGEEVSIGIEDHTRSVLVGEDLVRQGAWSIDASYAERTGPFSALDIVAGSGGYYELHSGIEPTCGFGGGDAPPELTGLRAISLTASWDTTSSCMDWWGVTLFLDGDTVRGVALRLGSP